MNNYYGQFEIDRYLNEMILNNQPKGFFVECGAADGLIESTCLHFKARGWIGINIEASPPLFDLLLKNRPNEININCALSNETSMAEFKHAIHPNIPIFGNGSLNHSKEHMDDLISQKCTFTTYQVKTDKFSNIFNIYANHQEIDLFVLDVEGAEIPALEGILELDYKFQPKVFCIEYTISGLDKIKNLLNNYTFHSNHHHNAIFIKK